MEVCSCSGQVCAPRQYFRFARARVVLRPSLVAKCSVSNGGITTPLVEPISWKQDAVADITPKKDSWQWALLLSYDGTRYSGWQIQPKGTTVQQTLESVLCQITRCTREELLVTAASRTDAGVHAWGQVVSFWTPFQFEQLNKLHLSLNSMLPHDIRIREVHAVQPDFSVRHHPISKTYQYKVYIGPVMDPCQRLYALHVPYFVNADAIQEAASVLVGDHNFSAFANSSRKGVISPVRRISKFTVASSGPNLILEVQSKAFLYKQVRNMVGLLLEIGKGTLPSRAVLEVLESQSRIHLSTLSSVAPGHGLHLMSVEYDKAFFVDFPKPSNGRQRQLRDRQSLSSGLSVNMAVPSFSLQ